MSCETYSQHFSAHTCAAKHRSRQGFLTRRVFTIAGGTRVTKSVAFGGHVPKATNGRTRFATPITSRLHLGLSLTLHLSNTHSSAVESPADLGLWQGASLPQLL